MSVETVERHPSPIARVEGLTFLILERPDLEKARAFFEDFGLVTIEANADRLRLRARLARPMTIEVRKGAASRLIGLAFSAGDAAALDALARSPGASAVTVNEPALGGRHVALTDPNGFRVEVHHGLTPLEELPARPPLTVNRSGATPRLNAGQRPPAGPSEVLKIGHVVINALAFRASLDWYMGHLGLIPSDVLQLADGAPAAVFLRVDRGDIPVEHHTMVVSSHMEAGFGHCAMEVADLDAIATGSDHLRGKGWRHAWGIGRHMLGSQLFDYWRDPWGARFEHYADSDMFDAAYPTGYHPLDAAGFYQWGPDLPHDFEDTRITIPRILGIFKALRQRNGELTLKRLKGLKAAMAAPARPWMK